MLILQPYTPPATVALGLSQNIKQQPTIYGPRSVTVHWILVFQFCISLFFTVYGVLVIHNHPITNADTDRSQGVLILNARKHSAAPEVCYPQTLLRSGCYVGGSPATRSRLALRAFRPCRQAARWESHQRLAV
jgi:hypothetical protein